MVASGCGQSGRLPSWYFNLRAPPEATVIAEGVAYGALAHEAENRKRERLWKLAVETYPGFTDYPRRVDGRSIPVIALSPRV